MTAATGSPCRRRMVAWPFAASATSFETPLRLASVIGSGSASATVMKKLYRFLCRKTSRDGATPLPGSFLGGEERRLPSDMSSLPDDVEPALCISQTSVVWRHSAASVPLPEVPG